MRNARALSRIAWTLAVGITGTASAWAEDKGFYLGAAGGGSLLDDTTGQVNQIAVASGFASARTNVDDTDLGWKVFGGYRAHRHFAVEAGYVDLGEAGFVTTTTGPDASIKGEAQADGFHFQAVGILPYTRTFAIYAKAGAFLWDVDAKVARLQSGVATAASVSESGTDYTFGFGATYRIMEKISLRAEWERYNNLGEPSTTGEGDVDFLSLGALYSF